METNINKIYTTNNPAKRLMGWLFYFSNFVIKIIPMLRHIIMFKLKENAITPEGKKMAETVKKELEKLKDSIDAIKKLEAGINVVDVPHAYDVILTVDFDLPEHLEIYKVHPAHQAFIKFNKNYSVSKAAVDYLY